jgi:hypothetical protein
MPFLALGDSIGGGIYQYTYPQATIEFVNKYMSQKLKGQDSTRSIIYLPVQTNDATDTLAKLSDVRAVSGGGGDFWKTSGTTILGGTDTIKSNNGTLVFVGGEEDMARFWLSANEVEIQSSNNLKFTGLSSTTDTTTYKPLGIDGFGKLAPLTSWISGGTTIDTTNQFVKRLDRTEGKDSIIYFVGGNRFAIKDSVGTNPAPVGYYGAFQDTTTQTAALINTAYGVKLGVTDLTNGVTISNNSRIKIANAGIYNIQFSLQLEKTGGSGNMIADIWLRKNGVNLQGTTGKVVLTGSANASPVVAAWNYVIAVASGDSLELMWATSNDNVVIKATAATSPHPSIPSAILTVTQQSGIMAGTGISPLDTANMLLPYLRKTDTASLSNRINTKLNATDTASLSNRINQTPTLTGYQLLGSNIKSFPLGITGFANTTGTLAHVSSRMYLVAFYIPQTTTITGAKWILTSTGTSYAGGANYNGLVLYSYNIATGLATRIDSTASDANTWATAIGTQSKAFVTPISLSPGIYYLGAMCNGTATTFPSIAQNTQTNGATTYDLASPARLTGAITGTVSAASFNLSTATANTNYPILMLY